MSTPDGWFAEDGTPFAEALLRARAARAAGDRVGVDRYYPEAVRLAGSAELAAALAVEHVDAVRGLRDSDAALAWCAGYRGRYPSATWLALIEAETRAMRGDFAWIDDDRDVVRALAATGSLPPRQAALAVRLSGLAAQHRGDFMQARERLADARARYRALDLPDGVTEVETDLRRLAARDEVPATAPADAAVPTAQLSTARALARAEELRMAGCYEDALDVIQEILARPIDPALVYPVCEVQVLLLRSLRRDEEVDGVLPELYQAADASAQPELNRYMAARLSRKHSAPSHVPPSVDRLSVDRRLQHVRRLVEAGQPEDAERLLRAEAGASDTRHKAEWHLAAGGLALALGLQRGVVETVGRAITHLERAADLARRGTLVPIRIDALRLLARAHQTRGDLRAVVRAAAMAREHEDHIAGLQRSDENRIRMLTGVVTEFDEQVRVAHEDIQRGQPFGVASVAIAIEAGRGAAILPRIAPEGARLVSAQLPPPGDGPGAWRWIRRSLRGLPWGQVMWLLHVTPTGLHHVLADWWALRYQYVNCPREDLRRPVEELRKCWEQGGKDLAGRAEEFRVRLHDLAKKIGVDDVVAKLPRRTRRLAIVAGDELSEIPFAALPCPGPQPGTRDLLGLRFALSDLPCLAVRQALRRQARRRRGPGALLLQPSAPGVGPPRAGEFTPLTAADEGPGREVLSRHEATPAALRDALASGVGMVRIDSHGTFGRNGEAPALFLWPVRGKNDPLSDGDLHPADLETRHPAATTVGTLVVGACRSGMSTRRGRDERIGFVRSGLLAGASAVLAARWDAEETVAATLLDAFEDNLRHLPRDVALQRAMALAARNAPPGAAGTILWSAWTLYGDAGPQTRRGPLRRWLARSWDAVRIRPPDGRSTPHGQP